MKKIKRIIRSLNFWREAKELGLPLWESPSFLFLVMGILVIVVMLITFFIANVYQGPEVAIVAVAVVSILILSLGIIIIRSVERIVQASILKTRFISVASHELRTPLSAIKWSLDLLLNYKKEDFNKESIEYLVAIQDNNEKLIKLTNDLLNMSRIESGVIMVNLQECSPIVLIEESIKEFNFAAKSSNIALRFIEPKEDVKNIGFLKIDHNRIKIILGNLINNAIKYTKKGGAVDVMIEKKKNNLLIKIKDTGVGIPKQEKRFIFEKFYRSGNELLHQTQGVGLGLYIAKSFTESLNGKIGFESDSDSGSVFWFSFPIKY